MLSRSDQTEVDENTKDILYLNERQSTQNTHTRAHTFTHATWQLI